VAQEYRIPAGSALAVDRDRFSSRILELLSNHPNITVQRRELSKPPKEHQFCIIAAGPLASEALTSWVLSTFSADSLYFYDAIAPIIATDSIDMDKAFLASRWNEGSTDYCNCPFTEDEYRVFYDALISADRVKARAFEQKHFFEACLPVEVVASRGFDSLAFGPLRPVGLVDPRSGTRPYAVCQLRKENASGESYSMVGFQTRMTIPEQKRVIHLIPGLEKAEFLRYGSIHRNTYFNSPSLLLPDLSFKQNPSLFLAGQICGNEGYTESIATGHLAALFVWAKVTGTRLTTPSAATACGALLQHITKSESKNFTPSNINFGLFDIPEEALKKGVGKEKKRELLCERALRAMEQWIKENF
jgi:methylenetetrahydrofolate--tRNA-(uracil-5-)-methyltransferase